MGSPVQPLIDLRDQWARRLQGAHDFIEHPGQSILQALHLQQPPPQPTITPPDTSWHDQMVRQANAAAQAQQAEQSAAPAPKGALRQQARKQK